MSAWWHSAYHVGGFQDVASHCQSGMCGFNSWMRLPYLSDEVKMGKTPMSMSLLGAFQEFQVVKINYKLPTKAF